VQQWAQRAPENIAIVAPGRAPLTYRSCSRVSMPSPRRSTRTASPETIASPLALANGPDMAVAFLGIASASACAPLNPALREGEMAAQLGELRAKALIVENGGGSAARCAAESIGIPVIALTPRPQNEAGAFELEGTPAAPATHRRPASRGDDVALVLQTSGTTSRPKIVPLTQSNLCASAQNVRAALELTEGDRCLGVMPLFHVHGLVGALLASLAAGASIVCTPGFYATEFFEWLDEFHPTWYTAVPSMHQAIASRASQHREVIARAPLRFVRSCSSPLPAPAAAALEDAFGVPVVDAYGMTEAAHQIASTPLGRRKPGSVGVAAGTEIAIIDAAGNPLPAGSDGEIAIRGPGVMRGYEATPNGDGAFAGSWLRTGDLGRLDGEDYLFITGRLKEIINRAGTKISPVEIEEALLAHPAVRDAAAFAIPHPELGEEPAAAAVLDPGAAGDGARASRVRRAAARRLQGSASRVDRRGNSPDAHRQAKARRAGRERWRRITARSAARRARSPHNALEALVADIWRQVLKAETVGVDDDFFQLGGDSILAGGFSPACANRRTSTCRSSSFSTRRPSPAWRGHRRRATRRRPRRGRLTAR
jgi:acyl-CoA synthetase (AMP-forming)/AMP-acid ligase II